MIENLNFHVNTFKSSANYKSGTGFREWLEDDNLLNEGFLDIISGLGSGFKNIAGTAVKSIGYLLNYLKDNAKQLNAIESAKVIFHSLSLTDRMELLDKVGSQLDKLPKNMLMGIGDTLSSPKQLVNFLFQGIVSKLVPGSGLLMYAAGLVSSTASILGPAAGLMQMQVGGKNKLFNPDDLTGKPLPGYRYTFSRKDEHGRLWFYYPEDGDWRFVINKTGGGFWAFNHDTNQWDLIRGPNTNHPGAPPPDWTKFPPDKYANYNLIIAGDAEPNILSPVDIKKVDYTEKPQPGKHTPNLTKAQPDKLDTSTATVTAEDGGKGGRLGGSKKGSRWGIGWGDDNGKIPLWAVAIGIALIFVAVSWLAMELKNRWSGKKEKRVDYVWK